MTILVLWVALLTPIAIYEVINGRPGNAFLIVMFACMLFGFWMGARGRR